LANNRVIAYIDGFNLYFGLKDKGWKRFYWLDVEKLIGQLLKPGQNLVKVKYFTARVTEPPDKRSRQAAFLGALGTRSAVEIYYGQYQMQLRTCRKCGNTYKTYSEKMTDVNLAVQMTADAFEDKFDTALLVCADADLTPPIAKIRTMAPGKKIIAVFPPGRYSYNLVKTAHAHFILGRANVAKSLLSDQVQGPDGSVFTRPTEWR
jgi:uncharacterized LabA/DUF88 family protein